MTRHSIADPAHRVPHAHRAHAAPRALAALFVLAAATFAATPAAAQNKARAACTPHPASDDLPSDRADGVSIEVGAAHPVGLANWDVGWSHRHRWWIAVTATNRGDGATSVLPELVVDLHRDGSLARSLVGDPIVLAPHGVATAHMTLWIPEDAKTVGLRLHVPEGEPAGADVAAAIAVECSDSRFDVGEMTTSAATLLEQALSLYVAQIAEPLPDEHKAFDDERALASGAQDASDVAWAMRGLMNELGDDGSMMRPSGPPAAVPVPVATQPARVEVRPDGTAVVRLGATAFESDAQRVAWAQALRDAIEAAARQHPRAWVVDLREHAGIDPWPSLAALSRLLEGPAVGSFVTRAGRQEWVVERGAARLAGGPAIVDLQAPPAPPIDAPVAVLLSAHTTNVGEAVAVAFEGRPNTHFFGATTHGATALGARAHLLADGSVLTVREARLADRTGVVYRGAIEPQTPTDVSGHTDVLPPSIVNWLLDEHARAGSVR